MSESRVTVDPALLLPGHLFDTEVLPAKNTPKLLEFFVRPGGTKMKHAPAVKTSMETSQEKAAMSRRFGARGIIVQYNGDATISDVHSLYGDNKFECADCHWCGIPAYEDLYFCPKCKKTSPQWRAARDNHARITFSINGKAVFACLLQQIPLVPIMTVLPVSAQYFKFLDAPSVLTIKTNDKIKATLSWPLKAPELSKDIKIRFGFLGAYTPQLEISQS